MDDGAGEGVLRTRSGDRCTGLEQVNVWEYWGEAASQGRGDRA